MGEFNAIKCGIHLMRLKLDNGEHNAACLSLSVSVSFSLSLTHTRTHTHHFYSGNNNDGYFTNIGKVAD
jgi:hypothetical protein